MEEEKAAAYYDELTRRGEGAARFKQGLGFSSAKSDSENAPSRGSALPSSSSFLSKFVKASSPNKESELRNQKQAQIESIQNKLKRKKTDPADEEDEEKQPPRVSQRENKHSRRRSRSRSRERQSRRRSGSRERYRDRERERERDRGRDRDGGRRRRGRSRSLSPRDRRKGRRSSRSSSPRERGLEKSKMNAGKERNGGGGADYSKLIQGYDKMSGAERVKAKMKLQLAETSEKDATKGMGSGWERFEFDKDAPLDDEEVEVAEDDGALVKHIGQSFRFSTVETKREEQIKAAHDEAMFGTSDNRPSIMIDSEVEAEDDVKDSKESDSASLLSDKVLAKKQGSWRDRIRDKKN